MNDKEEEQASESNGGKHDLNFKAKFVLTMLNITFTSTRGAGRLWRTTVERDLKVCYASYFPKHQFAFHLKLSLMTLKCW